MAHDPRHISDITALKRDQLEYQYKEQVDNYEESVLNE